MPKLSDVQNRRIAKINKRLTGIQCMQCFEVVSVVRAWYFLLDECSTFTLKIE